VKLETLLPLGKLDPGLRAPEIGLDFSKIAEDAQLLEEIGYDGVCIEETKQDPFIAMALAGQATRTLQLSTAVAIAFPRSPTVTALSAWNLQKLSNGRFTLGLGSQVKGHIERRYGLKWSPAGPWMREYVGALRAVWRCWQGGGPLDFQGEHYKLNLMVPLFDPGPIEHPNIPTHLAAVKSLMCRVAGEVADGLRPHPVCTPAYIENVMIPAVRTGAAKAQRSLEGFEIAMKPLVATAATEDELTARIPDVRARVSFYASTPAYLPAFEFHGLGDLARELSVLSRQQRWEEMSGLISDDVLHTYAVVGTHEQISQRLRERFGHVVTSVEFSIAVKNADDKEVLRRIVKDAHRHPGAEVRALLQGPKAA
jgi:probable F420-dependent oxidoreductase